MWIERVSIWQSTSQQITKSTNGSRPKLIRMSIRLLTGGQLVRFQPGAPRVFVRTLASGQAARLSIWRSRVRIPPSLPKSRSSNGSGHESTKLEIPVQIRSGAPILGASSSGQDGALSMLRRGFDSPRARQASAAIASRRRRLTCWSGVMADTLVLETSAYGRESSNLSSSTKIKV